MKNGNCLYYSIIYRWSTTSAILIETNNKIKIEKQHINS